LACRASSDFEGFDARDLDHASADGRGEVTLIGPLVGCGFCGLDDPAEGFVAPAAKMAYFS
jgi:hypothetical protein